jgi:hypothetical protein
MHPLRKYIDIVSESTLVKVHDGPRTSSYYVTQVRPEAAKNAALKKHRLRHGQGTKQPDQPLTVEIIQPSLGHEVSQQSTE